MKIYIIGHKTPDVDATTSTVVYAELLQKLNRYPNAELIPVVADSTNVETQFVFQKFGAMNLLPKVLSEVLQTEHQKDTSAEHQNSTTTKNPTPPAETYFILTDHNEEAQRDPLVVKEKVLEIIDHHKINIDFSSPIRLDVKPFGSTCSVIYDHFKTSKLQPSKHALGLMLGAILSDTVGLKSSTTTGMDSEIAHEIAQEIGEDLDRLTFDIFKAKSNIEGLSAMQICRKDWKIFDFGGTKVFIGQVETVEPEKALTLKADLLSALDEIKVTEGVGQAYLAITDILKVNSQMLYVTDHEREVVEVAFVTKGFDGVADIGPRMSRKKDIAPLLEKVVRG